MVSMLAHYQLACEVCRQGVKISGWEPQRAGFKSRCITICWETLGKLLNLAELPFFICKICTCGTK